MEADNRKSEGGECEQQDSDDSAVLPMPAESAKPPSISISMQKSKHRSGAQKRQLAVQKELKKSASDPKQQKMFLGPRQKTLSLLAISGEISSGCSFSTAKTPQLASTSYDLPLPGGSSGDLVPAEALTAATEQFENEATSAIITGENPEDGGLSQDVSIISCFVPPRPDDPLHVKLAFIRKHPIQPASSKANLPFKPAKLFYRPNVKDPDDPFQRKWLSYSTATKKLYCSLCMTFAKNVTFANGIDTTAKHGLYRTVDKHEKSTAHGQSVDSFLAAENEHDIESLIDKNLQSKRQAEITKRRDVIKRLIDITAFIARQGLAYRGKSGESGYELCDRRVNHGNFLELVLLVAKYDPILSEHVSTCVSTSKKRKQRLAATGKSVSKGRGSLITFLSKTFINSLIKAMCLSTTRKLVQEVKSAKIFSLQVDSTQDVAVLDQLAIVVRYVDREVNVQEKLIKLVVATHTAGEALYKKIKAELGQLGLDMKNIIGCSFDGAANMKGSYTGLQAWLKTDNPNSLYTHCVAHNLNLVIADATQCTKTTDSFFGLLGNTAVFLSESHKRMRVWKDGQKETFSGSESLKRLQKIGATRWWSKDKALHGIFGNGTDTETVCKQFSVVLKTLQRILISPQFDSKARFQAKVLLSNWCKFETVMTGIIYLEMFKIISPVSKYLQSQTLDYLSAWNHIFILKGKLEKFRNSFHEIYHSSKSIMSHINEIFDCDGEGPEGDDLQVETDFPQHKRVSKKKPMSGETVRDERGDNISVADLFKVETFFVICDSAFQSVTERFNNNQEFLKDCASMDPKHFEDIIKNGLRSERLECIAKLMKTDRATLAQQLTQFANYFKAFGQPLHQADESQTSDSDDGKSDDEDSRYVANESKSNGNHQDCMSCLACATKILHQHNLYNSMYTELYMAYKFILTMPSTQVSCERVFSKLKIIKSRLRSTIGQDLLESLLLMNIERTFFITNSEYDLIIDEIASQTAELKRLLII